MFSNFELPLNLTLLPLDGSLLHWTLNYCHQLVSAVLGTLFLSLYWPMILIVMNQTSWMADCATIRVQKLDEILGRKFFVLYQSETEEALKLIIESCKEIVDWQKKAQNLLKFDFLRSQCCYSSFACQRSQLLLMYR